MGGNSGTLALEASVSPGIHHVVGREGISFATSSDANRHRREVLVPLNGSLSNFTVRLQAALDTGSWQLWVMINGVKSALTVTLSGATVLATDSVNNVSVSAGDLICIIAEKTGTPSDVGLGWSMIWNGSTKECVMMGSTINDMSTTTVEYFVPSGAETSSTSSGARQIIFPFSATIKNFRVHLTVAPGSGKSRTFEITRTGGVDVVSVTISDSNTDGSNTSDSISVSIGERIEIKSTPSGTPDAAVANFGFQVQPDEDGKSALFMHDHGGKSQEGTVYSPTVSSILSQDSTETDIITVCPGDFIFGGFYMRCTVVSGGAGTGAKYVLDFRKNRISTGVGGTFFEDNNTDFDFLSTFVATNGDIFNYRIVAENNPTATSTWMSSLTAYDPDFLRPMIFYSLSSDLPFIFYDLPSSDPMIFSSRT